MINKIPAIFFKLGTWHTAKTIQLHGMLITFFHCESVDSTIHQDKPFSSLLSAVHFVNTFPQDMIYLVDSITWRQKQHLVKLTGSCVVHAP